MTSAVRRTSGRPLAAGAALLLLAGWLLWTPGAGAASGLFTGEDRPSDAAAPDRLRASGADGEPSDAGPTLAVRAADRVTRDARGPVRVRVLGPGERPLPGLRLEVTPAEAAHSPVAAVQDHVGTDERGEACFADLPYDGSVAVRITSTKQRAVRLFLSDHESGFRPAQREGPIPIATAPVTGGEVTLRCAMGIPLHVDVLDTQSGHRLGGVRWATVPGFALCDEGDGPPTRASRPLAVAPGSTIQLELKLTEVPAGRLVWDATRWPVSVHPAAARLLAQMPLRREAEVIVTFAQPAPDTAGLPWTATAALGTKQHRLLEAEADAWNRWHLRGLPFLPGEVLHVGGSIGRWRVEGRTRLSREADALLRLVAALTPMPEPAEPVIRGRSDSRGVVYEIASVNGEPLRIVWSSGTNLHVDLAAFLGQEIKLENPGFTPAPKPTFRVLVQHPDGRPAPGARVAVADQSAVAGAGGVAVFQDLPVSTYPALVWGAGAVFRQDVTVPPGGVGQAAVRGGVGGLVHLEVVDADGHPVPFAHLAVQQPSGQPFCDLMGDVQRIDPFTGANGRRTLHEVEPGEVSITARLGTREATVALRVSSARSATARIVLPAASSADPQPAAVPVHAPTEDQDR